MYNNHLNLFRLLVSTFNPEGDIHILAIAEKEIQSHEKERPVHQVRVALTFQEGGTVNPYYDGTDLFVTMGEDDIRFTLEEDWADDPPAIEGSPIELALGWVSELANPFYVSPEALAAAKASKNSSHGSTFRDSCRSGGNRTVIDLTSDSEIDNLYQSYTLPHPCLSFIQEYMQQISSSFEDETFPPFGHWFFILEANNQLTPGPHEKMVFSCTAGTYYPEYIERYTFDNSCPRHNPSSAIRLP